MGFETYSNMWKALVEAGSAALMSSGCTVDPRSPVGQRLRQISVESGQMRVALALSHPTHLTAYHCAMGQVGPSPWPSAGNIGPEHVLHRVCEWLHLIADLMVDTRATPSSRLQCGRGAMQTQYLRDLVRWHPHLLPDTRPLAHWRRARRAQSSATSSSGGSWLCS